MLVTLCTRTVIIIANYCVVIVAKDIQSNDIVTSRNSLKRNTN